MRKILMNVCLLLIFGAAGAFFSSCSSYQGFDVNDTWRPKQHKPVNLSAVPHRTRGKR